MQIFNTRAYGPQDREDRKEYSIYEKCLLRELELRGIPASGQISVPIEYKGYGLERVYERVFNIVDDQIMGWY